MSNENIRTRGPLDKSNSPVDLSYLNPTLPSSEQRAPIVLDDVDDDRQFSEFLNGQKGPTHTARNGNFFLLIAHTIENIIRTISGSDPQTDRSQPQSEDRPGVPPISPADTTPNSPLPPSASAPDRSKMKTEGLDAQNDWQKVLYEHAKLNKHGLPVDEKGKEINIRDMDPEFGRKLADTCIDLDKSGYKGQYYILSGVRTHEEQRELYEYYKGRGSNHPVAAPGHSPHEWGLATDIQYTGKGSKDEFYRIMHEKGGDNHLAFVENDPNHIEIPNAKQVAVQKRREQDGTAVAANHKPPTAHDHPAMVAG